VPLIIEIYQSLLAAFIGTCSLMAIRWNWCWGLRVRGLSCGQEAWCHLVQLSASRRRVFFRYLRFMRHSKLPVHADFLSGVFCICNAPYMLLPVDNPWFSVKVTIGRRHLIILGGDCHGQFRLPLDHDMLTDCWPLLKRCFLRLERRY
jgi:hypothetical protein